VRITVNGRKITVDRGDAAKNLLTFLREDLDLTGAKRGCGIGACGACTILVDEEAVRSCRKRVGDVAGRTILTVEGMSGKNGELHPLQQAFIDAGAIQCGFCTPGMVMSAHAFLLRNPVPGRDEIRKALAAHLCRCTGYQQIVDAVEIAAAHYLSEAKKKEKKGAE
jgi:aerobic carbon-monoxide dehydrogenase small subunit